MAEGALEVEGDEAGDTSVRRTQVTMRGEGAPLTDSLFNEDEEAEEPRGPEWCVDDGVTLVAMNKFALWLALGAGDMSPTTRVWRVGRERWQPANEIPDLACAVHLHGQTLLAAARVAKDADRDREQESMEAATPVSPTALAVPCASDPPATAELDPSPIREEVDKDRPTEPDYVVRSVVGRTRRPSRAWALAGLAAAAALVLVVRTTASRAPLPERALAAEAGGIFPVPDVVEAPEVVQAPEVADARPATATEPIDLKQIETAVTIHIARPTKSVSPTHRGQARAQRKGR